jgi:hypothetical protein
MMGGLETNKKFLGEESAELKGLGEESGELKGLEGGCASEFSLFVCCVRDVDRGEAKGCSMSCPSKELKKALLALWNASGCESKY